NGTYEITANPVAEFKANVTLGIDTAGFYVSEGSQIESNVEIFGGVQGNLVIDGEIGPLDLVEGTGSATIGPELNFFFSEPEDSLDDEKLRAEDLSNPDNVRVFPELKLLLDLDVDAGFKETGHVRHLASEHREIILWRGEEGGVSDIEDELVGFQEELKRRADIIACQLAAATRDNFAVIACGQQILDDPLGFVEGFIRGNDDSLEQHLEDLGVLLSDIEDLANRAFKAVEVGPIRYANEVLGHLGGGEILLDVLGLRFLGGSGNVEGLLNDLIGGSIQRVNVDPEPLFDHKLEDGVLTISGWDSAAASQHFGMAGVDLAIDIQDGKVIVDGPNYQRLGVTVAKKKKNLWSKTEKIHKDIEDSNSVIYDASSIHTVVIVGTDHDDLIQATDSYTGHLRVEAMGGSDKLAGGGGTSVLSGGDGDDTIVGSLGSDAIEAGAGNDVVDGRSGIDNIAGDSGDDTLVGNDGDDTITGGTGNDVIIGGDGNDTISGDDGDDRVRGESGDDRIQLGPGNDYSSGGDGDDSIRGNDGSDTIYGDDGEDYLLGGDGDDVIFGGRGTDSLRGNDGNDIIYGDQRNGDGHGNDQIYGGLGDDGLYGGKGNDVIVGGRGDDGLFGGSGNDELIGDDRVREPDTWFFDSKPFAESGIREIEHADFDKDGIEDVAYIVNSVSSTIAERIEVHLGREDGAFTQSYYEAMPSIGSRALGLGDINNDGLIDLVVSGNFGSPNKFLKVLLNNGTGGFVDATTMLAEQPIHAVTDIKIADLNGDGLNDLAMDHGGNVLIGNSISIAMADPAGGISAPVKITITEDKAGGTQYEGLDLADLDHDGDVDIVTARTKLQGIRNTSAGAFAYVLMNQGEGSFSDPQEYVLEDVRGGYRGIQSMQLMDIDRDGSHDIISYYVGSHGQSQNVGGQVIIRRGDGMGTFDDPIVFDNPHFHESFDRISIRDVNSDGRLDFSFLAKDNNNHRNPPKYMSLWTQQPDGSFTETRHEVGPVPMGAEASFDFNGDGADDLILGGRLYVNNGTGVPEPSLPVTLPDLQSPTTQAFGDFDGDDVIEIASVRELNEDGVRKFYLQVIEEDALTGGFKVEYEHILSNPSQVWSLATSDFNGDGNPDIFLTNSNPRGSSLLFPGLANDQVFAVPANYSTIGSRYLVVHDSDHDGDSDLAYSANGRSFELIENLRDGEAWRIPGVEYPESSRDRISGGPGNDSIDGGPDNDYIVGDGGHDFIKGDIGNDLIRGGGGSDQIFGGAGDDQIEGTSGSDVILGEEGDDILVAGQNSGGIIGGELDNREAVESFA
ncbi:MAG: FG-GAP-like repeat-containing protein, partial [Planctomycetota bacterium]